MFQLRSSCEWAQSVRHWRRSLSATISVPATSTVPEVFPVGPVSALAVVPRIREHDKCHGGTISYAVPSSIVPVARMFSAGLRVVAACHRTGDTVTTSRKNAADCLISASDHDVCAVTVKNTNGHA